MPQYEYVARHFNEDPLPSGLSYSDVSGTPLDTADGDTTFIEVYTPPSYTPMSAVKQFTFRWEPVGDPAPPMDQWTQVVIYMGAKHYDGTYPGFPTLVYVDSSNTVGGNFGQSYYPDFPDQPSADGYTIYAMVLKPADWSGPDGYYVAPIGPNSHWVGRMFGDYDGATSRFTYVRLVVYTPDPPPPPPPTMRRPHLHLPITKADGDLLLFADVSLIDPTTGAEVTPKVYDGPNDLASEITWPVTFAPANVDLWLDEPGRYDMRVIGPEGYSAIIRGVDFAPAAPNQAVGGVQIASAPAVRRWLQADSDKQARFRDPGLIGPHDHDGSTTHSTSLGHAPTPVDPWLNSRPPQVNSEDYRTSLGYGTFLIESSASRSGMVVLGAGSTTQDSDTTIIGPFTDAGLPGLTQIGDHVAGSVPDDAVRMANNKGGADPFQVDLWDEAMRAVMVWDPDGNSGQVISSLGYTYDENSNLTMPAGLVNRDPFFLRGQARAAGLEVRGNAQIGNAGTTVGFYGSDGATQGPHLTGATGVLADLITALESIGFLATS